LHLTCDAAAGTDIAEFSSNSSDETVSVVRGSTAVINCNVPASVPSPPVVSYLRDGRPFTLTSMYCSYSLSSAVMVIIIIIIIINTIYKAL